MVRVGYFHDDTMGDFDFEWQGSGYRGHYNVIPSGSLCLGFAFVFEH